jgi:hypothetical protein
MHHQKLLSYEHVQTQLVTPHFCINIPCVGIIQLIYVVQNIQTNDVKRSRGAILLRGVSIGVSIKSG